VPRIGAQIEDKEHEDLRCSDLAPLSVRGTHNTSPWIVLLILGSVGFSFAWVCATPCVALAAGLPQHAAARSVFPRGFANQFIGDSFAWGGPSAAPPGGVCCLRASLAYRIFCAANWSRNVLACDYLAHLLCQCDRTCGLASPSSARRSSARCPGTPCPNYPGPGAVAVGDFR
jgi:hypothetical protein